jgi:hypothetical protein
MQRSSLVREIKGTLNSDSNRAQKYRQHAGLQLHGTYSDPCTGIPPQTKGTNACTYALEYRVDKSASNGSACDDSQHLIHLRRNIGIAPAPKPTPPAAEFAIYR